MSGIGLNVCNAFTLTDRIRTEIHGTTVKIYYSWSPLDGTWFEWIWTIFLPCPMAGACDTIRAKPFVDAVMAEVINCAEIMVTGGWPDGWSAILEKRGVKRFFVDESVTVPPSLLVWCLRVNHNCAINLTPQNWVGIPPYNAQKQCNLWSIAPAQFTDVSHSHRS